MQTPNQPPIPALIQLLQTGQLESLVRHATDCTARWPNAGPVWHLLGLAHLNLGHPDKAIPPLTRAGKLIHGDAQVSEHLAIALMQAGRPKEAYRSFERCLALAPDQVGTLINLAHLANELGNPAAAESHCRQALRLAPEQPEALYNLGRALGGLGRKDEAVATFRKVAARTANSPAAQNDTGLQLQELGAVTDAEACFRRAIALAPNYARAYSNLGMMLQDRGHVDEALGMFQKAAALDPSLPAVHANIGGLLNSLHRFAEGEAACRLALKLDPRLAASYCNLANALMGQERHGEAETAFQQALRIDAGNADARNNLGNLFQKQGRYGEAAAAYRLIRDDDGTALGNAYHCSAQAWDWSRRRQDEAALQALLQKDDTSIGPFGLLAMAADQGPALQRRAAWLYARKHFRAALERPPLVAPAHHPARDRLRIGYLSADFHEHATMHLLSGVLAAHDSRRFAIHLYSYGPNSQDRGRQQALAAAETFRDFGNASDGEAAARIAADGIDIVVDLKGYTQDARLGITAQRPAPVIVSWLGYPGTLGHERLADYIIGDRIVTPPEHAAHFSETLALLPHCYQPNDRHREIGPRPSRQEAGLPDTGFVFCSFNQSYKFNPEVFDIWCRLLKEVGGSVLWLLKPAPAAMENLRREAASRGVEPARLVFADRKPLAEHLGRLQLADLALDTFPYGSHTTGSDALWAGVPLLTRLGDTFASRVGASLLNAVGLPELVTRTWDDYLALARELALQPETMAGFRNRLAVGKTTAPLFDTEGFARELEHLYQEIWRQHAQGKREILESRS